MADMTESSKRKMSVSAVSDRHRQTEIDRDRQHIKFFYWFQDYLVKFQSLILEVEHSMQYQLDTVNRWREKWQQSVVKVRQLY